MSENEGIGRIRSPQSDMPDVNFFPFHIGDYAEAASHLSILEDGVYNRMIRKYYALEHALPISELEIFRLLNAKKRVERDATRRVLNEFFDLREDGWHNQRCDEEIAKYLADEPERQAKKDAEEARNKRFREERAALFADLRTAGQHLAWNAPMAMVRELHGRYCKKPATPPATGPATLQEATCNAPATATQSHPPSPITQYPIPTPSSASPQRGRKRGGDVGKDLKGTGLSNGEHPTELRYKTADELEREEAARADG